MINLVVPPGAWGDWINGGGWLVINGYHVDLILRDIKRVEQIIKDTEQGIVTANYQTGHPHGYMKSFEILLKISDLLFCLMDLLHIFLDFFIQIFHSPFLMAICQNT